MHTVWGRWAPPFERTQLVNFAASGSYVGTVVSLPLSGFLAEKFGWESVFYVCGAIVLIWLVFWCWIVKSSPEEDPYITREELKYIQDSLSSENSQKNVKHPWKKFLTSLPVWAIIVAHFSENWGFYTLLTQLPTFMRDVLHYKVEKGGIMAALPYLMMAIVMQVRKLFNCGGFIGQTSFMLLAALVLTPTGAMVGLTIAVGLGGLALSGTLPGIISPLVTGFIVQHQAAEEWQKIFYIASGVYLFGAIFYGLFASGEVQSWAKEERQEETNQKKEEHCYTNTAMDTEATREFDWDTQIQGLVLSAFFYGYITTQIPAAWLTARLGGKIVYAMGVGGTALCAVLTPILARQGVGILIAVRIVQGLFDGLTIPCMHTVWSRWSPPLERTQLVNFASSGTCIGMVVMLQISGFLAEQFGWESIFHVSGGFVLIWLIFWCWIGKGAPEEDPFITQEELKYIQDSLSSEKSPKDVKHPWKKIVTSLPVWAIVVAHVSINWGFYTLLTQLPIFMKNVLHYELGKTGIMSSLPYLMMALVMLMAGKLADWLRQRNILSTVQVRKLFCCGAFLCQGGFMLMAALVLTPEGAISSLTICMAFGGFTFSGFFRMPKSGSMFSTSVAEYISLVLFSMDYLLLERSRVGQKKKAMGTSGRPKMTIATQIMHLTAVILEICLFDSLRRFIKF
ncbi:hypothetical protein C0J52_10915 [Blattella germanica]|nr:hypothetical protein C0J52_10915 [Blattella germanica]